MFVMLKERERHRQHVMLMKTMEARKKAEVSFPPSLARRIIRISSDLTLNFCSSDLSLQEKERVKQEKRDEKRLNKERRQELRRLELEMSRELNKPNEDMCLSDQKVNHITTAHLSAF